MVRYRYAKKMTGLIVGSFLLNFGLSFHDQISYIVSQGNDESLQNLNEKSNESVRSCRGKQGA